MNSEYARAIITANLAVITEYLTATAGGIWVEPKFIGTQ